MNIAITGASGFIGKSLLKRCLAEGHSVRVLTRRTQEDFPPQTVICEGDLTGTLPRALVDNTDVLFHCAGEIRDPRRMYAVNVSGTANLIALASGCVGRWVQLSSVGTYGPRLEGEVTEEAQELPLGPYEISKSRADGLVAAAAGKGAFEYSVLRPSIVFGAGMPNRSLFQMIGMIDRGLFFFIGKRGAAANYVHVDNAVAALLLCAREAAAGGRVYNLSDHRSMEAFVAAIATALGRPVPRLRLPKAPMRVAARLLSAVPGFPLTVARVQALCGRASYPIDRIARELGYRHSVSMEEGLAETVRAWRGLS